MKQIRNIPFASAMGFELRRMEGGKAELFYAPLPEHWNSFGVVHGGATMAMLDIAMSAAARSVFLDNDEMMGAVTIEMKTSFMRPAQGPLVCRAGLLHRSATMAFTEGRVFNEKKQLCCLATATFKYARRLHSGGRQIKNLSLG